MSHCEIYSGLTTWAYYSEGDSHFKVMCTVLEESMHAYAYTSNLYAIVIRVDAKLLDSLQIGLALALRMDIPLSATRFPSALYYAAE
jgi:hypothetical protein